VKPRWVSLELALVIHNRQLAEHGGAEGIRDMNGLQAALARPENLLAYGEKPSLFRLAAAYAAGIVKNHPFVDGNKRVALVVCMTFLELNGVTTKVSEEKLAILFERLAGGEMTEKRFAEELEELAMPKKKPQRQRGR
jgi:death on curing protein